MVLVNSNCRYLQIDFGSTANAAIDVQLSAQHLHTLAQGSQTDGFVLVNRLHDFIHVKPYAIIFDTGSHPVVINVKGHIHIGTMSVLPGVLDQLLNDAKYCCLSVGLEPAFLSSDSQVDRKAAFLLKTFEILFSVGINPRSSSIIGRRLNIMLRTS